MFTWPRGFQEHVRHSSGRVNLEGWPSLHVPLFDVYQFSFLARFAAICAVLHGPVERLAGASGAEQRRVRVLTEGLRLVHLVAGLWTILELEDDENDEDDGDQCGGYDADYQRRVLCRLGRYPLVVVVVLRRRWHRRVDGRWRRWRWVRHLRGRCLGRHGARSLRHNATATFETSDCEYQSPECSEYPIVFDIEYDNGT